jgi:long-chain acyl-CoA synthetase
MLVTAHALEVDPARDGRVAVRGSGDALSYPQLRAQAAAVARHSDTWSAHDDDRAPYVAIMADWTPQFIACFLGLASAGWAVGVLDPSWSESDVAGAITQLDPCAVIVDEECRAVAAATTRTGWRKPTQMDSGWTVFTRGEDVAAARPAPAAVPDAAFYVGFTSGSSGRPKAFVRSHRSWWESFERFTGLCPIDAEGTVLVPGPLSSSHFLFGALHALHVGATVELVTSSEYSPEHVANRLAQIQRFAGLYVVPTMLSQHAQGPPGASDPDYIFCAGARLELDVRERTGRRFATSRLVEYYGASELSFVAIQVDGDGTPPGSVGRVFPGVEVTIRDDEDRVIGPDEAGLIFARGPLLFLGYRGEPPVSGARALDGGWLTVGDRGALDEDGFLSIAGRGSSLIITGGANVQPEEVEEIVAGHPGVAACVVVGLPDPMWGEVLCAVVVVRPGATIGRADLRSYVAGTLTRYKRPRRYVLAGSPLPTGRTGKVDRHAVRQLVLDGATQEIG